MQTLLLAASAALTTLISTAQAEPLTISDAQIDGITAGGSTNILQGDDVRQIDHEGEADVYHENPAFGFTEVHTEGTDDIHPHGNGNSATNIVFVQPR